MSFTFQEFTAQQPLTPETKAVALREEKVNPAYAAITTISDLPMPSTLPRNYKAFCREGFTNDSVFKCCSYIMQNGGSIPPKLYTDKTMKKGTIDSHPLLDKLDQPNLEQTGVDYREGILGFLLLAGNSYQYSIRKGIKAPPDELWSLQPDLVKIVPSRLRGITGYTYDDFSKEQNPIDPANIGRLRFWSPSDPLYGFSPMEVAAIMVDMQTAAKKWNLALLQNFAKPSGAWTSEAVLSPNDYSKTLEKLREIFAGFANAGKTQLLDGNLKWQQTGMAPTDVDWLEGIRYNAGSIANIFNIAPQLIGDTSSTTYDNMDQAKAASYTEAIFPLLDKLYALWNNWLLPMYPDLKGAYLYYDKETVEVVQAIIQAKNSAKIEQATKQFLAGGVDMYTYQEMCGTKPDPNGKGIYRVGPILVSSDNLKDYAEQAMKTPAGSPMLVPEPVDLNAPPDDPNNPNPVQGNETQNNQPAPTKPPKKPAGNEQEPAPKKSRKTKDDEEEEHTGVMIALFLDKASAKKLAIKDGEPPEDLHITLAFLGDKNEIDLDIDDLKDVLTGYASEAIPLEGNVSGVARFAASESSDNMSPVVALVNISGLQKWRDALVKQVELAGYEVAKDFEYTPHITLAYIAEDESMPVESVPDLELSFDTLWLAVGDDRYSFAIGDEQYPAKKRHLSTVHKKAASGVTHLLWECAPGACEFCLENDGQIVEDGESFNNGVTSPDDCHKFCKCSAYQLSIPDDTDWSGLGKVALVTMFAIGYIESRHDQDVQEQQQEEEDDSEEEDCKTIQLEAIREAKRLKLASKMEYQQFMNASLK